MGMTSHMPHLADAQDDAPPAVSLAEAERFLLNLPASVLLSPGAHPLILQSFVLAAELHKHQKRKSGEPYFTHPVAVAQMLCELAPAVDAQMVCAALLHDVIEDCGITREDLAAKTTLKIAEMVDGLTKIVGSDGHSDEEETFEKFARFAKTDARIAFIKFADLLHNLKTIDHLSEERQAKYRAGTLGKYVPFARSIKQDRIADLLEKKAKKQI